MNFADEIAQDQYRYSSESIYSNIDQHAPKEKFLQYFDIHIIFLLLPNGELSGRQLKIIFLFFVTENQVIRY